MTAHEPTASWVNPLGLEAERAHQERDLLLSTLRWIAGRADGAFLYASDHPRTLGADFWRGVLEEILEEATRALRAAQPDGGADGRLIAAAPGMLAALRLVARDAMTLGACLRDETVVAVGAALTAAQEEAR